MFVSFVSDEGITSFLIRSHLIQTVWVDEDNLVRVCIDAREEDDKAIFVIDLTEAVTKIGPYKVLMMIGFLIQKEESAGYPLIEISSRVLAATDEDSDGGSSPWERSNEWN